RQRFDAATGLIRIDEPPCERVELLVRLFHGKRAPCTRHGAGRCGDGGGSNSPSKALDWIASTSVVGDFLSRDPERAPTRFRSPQVGCLTPAYRPIGGSHLRFRRPSRP